MATVDAELPRFSVIMPAHNASATIKSAIRSVLLQSLSDFELIVADDGSTDDTAAQASSLNDPRVRVIRQERAGPSAARNAGIAVARGRFISMIDSDDFWLPRYLETLGKALETDPQAGLAYTDAWVLEERTGRIRRKTAMAYQHPPNPPPVESGDFLRILVDRNFVFSHATVRRSVLEQVGTYDERLGQGEDFELWLRIVEAGFRGIRAPGTVAIYRRHPRSLTSDLPRAYDGICKTYSVIVNEHVLDDETRAIARARYEWWLKQRDAVADPPLAWRLRRVAGRVKRRLLARALWLPQPPLEVTETLRACGFDTASRNDVAALPT
jgi:glycosyltransferase involved in cell wall biosynthesis